jgi:hypothetical protein
MVISGDHNQMGELEEAMVVRIAQENCPLLAKPIFKPRIQRLQPKLLDGIQGM